MGVVKTAIIAPINAAISSNVIKKFSEVSAVNLTDAKKASVTNATYYKEAMQWAENYINGYGR